MKLIASLSLMASLALCQEDVFIFQRQVGPPPGPGAEKNVTFFANGPQKLVKNAPYMADSVTESVQTLADGNRIMNTNKSSFARDSEGRTRRESTIQSLGNIGSTEAPIVSVFIDDPVAKLSYSLDPRAKVAFKSKSDKPEGVTFTRKMDAAAAPAGTKGSVATTATIEREVVFRTESDGALLPGGPMPIAAMQVRSDVKKANLRKEDLGAKTIEGVSARGTRTIMTIPAGEAGNERPLEVVTESWYSEDLKATVLNIHTDPRMGTVTTRLANVRLGEPSKSLFEPPTDYKVEEGMSLRRDIPRAVIRIKEEI
jgi:hypothetical protein